ncbi:MAG: ArnT family glycosyltransferase [Bacteroidia bacterium]
MKQFQYAAILCFGLAMIVYLLGMMVPVMEVDAAQYASISQQYLHESSYLQIKHRDFEYLDKPPLLFWLSAASIKAFGVNSFAYKLPSVLALLLAVFSTFRFSKLQYDTRTSISAALILMCCQAFFIIANDCKTDNLLIGFSMLAIWKIAAYVKTSRPLDVYIGFAAIGFAMLAKGPLGLVFTFFTIGAILLHERKTFKIRWHWLMAVPIIGFILLPMSIGLYQQHGREGLGFFFWTQSFGRITGQSEWSNDTDPFFLVHSFMWAFLPFILIFIVALFQKIRNAFTGKKLSWMDYGMLGGFLLTMFALSLSRFKLPHYIFIVCPLAAVLCAQYLASLKSEVIIERLAIGQFAFLVCLSIAAIALVFIFNETLFLTDFVLLGVLLAGVGVLVAKFKNETRILLVSVWTIILLNGILSTSFYPKLLQYQSYSEAALYIQNEKLPIDQVVVLHTFGHAFSYYLDTTVPVYGNVDQITLPAYVFTDQRGLNELQVFDHQVIKRYEDFSVSNLTGKFLNPATRPDVISERFLVRVE